MKRYLFLLTLASSTAQASELLQALANSTNNDPLTEQVRSVTNGSQKTINSMDDEDALFAEYKQQRKADYSPKTIIRTPSDIKNELYETGEHIKILNLIYSNLKEGNYGLDEPRGQMIKDLFSCNNYENSARDIALSAAVEFHKNSTLYIKLLQELEDHKK